MKPASLLILLTLFMTAPAIGQQADAARADDWGNITVTLPGGETVSVRLAGIELPRPGSPGHALAMQFMDFTLAEAPSLVLLPAEGRTDRYGFLVTNLELGGESLSHLLVREGYALAYSWPDTRAEGHDLLPVEQEAREAGRGLWGAGVFAVRSADPNTLALFLETVQIVEGRVIDVAETRDRTYLNFGFDYRTDFTVSIASADRALFTEAGVNLAGLEGRNVRVRGWLHAINGPSMALDHPERLEVLTPFEAD